MSLEVGLKKTSLILLEDFLVLLLGLGVGNWAFPIRHFSQPTTLEYYL